MRIILAGGGSGGHFYPLIAVSDELNKMAEANQISEMELYYMSNDPFDKKLLYDNHLTFVKNTSGKWRRYFSFRNLTDFFKTGWGILVSIIKLYKLYPDVVFSKGGFASFPALIAAWFLRIPVVIHESDSVPGIVNKIAGKFARSIAISYPESASFFDVRKVALTGQPIREGLLQNPDDDPYKTLGLEPSIPVIFILGGSQGAALINEAVIDALPNLLKNYQIIHQAGKENFEQTKKQASITIGKSHENRSRYHPYGFLNLEDQRRAYRASDIVISRAGSTIFEIAAWGIPSIIIPITKSNGNHQRKNAFAYSQVGACKVIEEANLTPNIIVSEVDSINNSREVKRSMRDAAQGFARTDAAQKIAARLIQIAQEHE